MRKYAVVALVCAMGLCASVSAQERQYAKVATWNLAWLTDRTSGIPDNVKPKSAAGLRLLSGYARELNADIVAVQEVDGDRMLAEVFDTRVYDLHMADENDVQRTGFAVRKSIRFTKNPDAVDLDATGGSLRRGADITVTLFGQQLRMLAVHLKCCCPAGDLDRPSGQHCPSLSRQVPPLKKWIDERTREGGAFIILGDFNRHLSLKRGSSGRLVVDDMWRDMTRNGVALHRVTEGMRSTCWGGNHAEFIDHVILNGAAKRLEMPRSVEVLAYRETDPHFASVISDHCPVSVKLRRAN